MDCEPLSHGLESHVRMSHDKLTLEEPQSHTDTDGGGAAAARQTSEPPSPSSDQPAAQKVESPSHTQNDGGGS